MIIHDELDQHFPEAEPRCRFCGCTEACRCRLPEGDECVWLTRTRDRCSNTACVLAYTRERQKESLARRLELVSLTRPVRDRWWAQRQLDADARRRRQARRRKQLRRAA